MFHHGSKSPTSRKKHTMEKVRVRFVTTADEFRISDAPISIPSKLGRSGLSEIINHFLGREDDQVPFDFLISGSLLRTTVKKYVQTNRISTENVIEIQYMPAMTLSDESQSVEVPAWVGSIDSSHSDVIYTGCYDGSVQVLNKISLDIISTFSAHSDPVRAVRSISVQSGGYSSLLSTASKDMTVKLWGRNGSTESVHAATCVGHSNSVESLSYWEARGLLLTGDWNGNVCAFEVQNLPAVETNSSDPKKKKKKTNDNKDGVSNTEAKELKPIFSLRPHTQNVSGIHVVKDNGMFTCSWDHALKKWDIERQDCVATFASSKVMTSVHSSEVGSADVVLTSHPDGKVRLWDARLVTDSNAQNVFGTSKDPNNADAQWISQVKWHPTLENIFGCVDYAGTVSVWDTRSSIPLGSSSSHSGKALCLDWLSNETAVKIVSGGSDCCVKATELL